MFSLICTGQPLTWPLNKLSNICSLLFSLLPVLQMSYEIHYTKTNSNSNFMNKQTCIEKQKQDGRFLIWSFLKAITQKSIQFIEHLACFDLQQRCNNHKPERKKKITQAAGIISLNFGWHPNCCYRKNLKKLNNHKSRRMNFGRSQSRKLVINIYIPGEKYDEAIRCGWVGVWSEKTQLYFYMKSVGND